MAYIYEHIRTRGYEPLHFEKHYARLDALARKLFLAPIAIGSTELHKMVVEKLQKEGCSPKTINAVCVKYSDNESVDIEVEEMLYNSFALRAIRPRGYLCRISGEMLLDNTSAKEAMLELNRSMGHIADSGVPIWIDDKGEILAIDGAPAVAVFDTEIKFSRWGAGVEFDIAQEIGKKRNRKVVCEAVTEEDLTTAKEILFIDYRGVTVLEKYGRRHYADIVAENIAKQVALSEQ